MHKKEKKTGRGVLEASTTEDTVELLASLLGRGIGRHLAHGHVIHTRIIRHCAYWPRRRVRREGQGRRGVRSKETRLSIQMDLEH